MWPLFPWSPKGRDRRSPHGGRGPRGPRGQHQARQTRVPGLQSKHPQAALALAKQQSEQPTPHSVPLQGLRPYVSGALGGPQGGAPWPPCLVRPRWGDPAHSGARFPPATPIPAAWPRLLPAHQAASGGAAPPLRPRGPAPVRPARLRWGCPARPACSGGVRQLLLRSSQKARAAPPQVLTFWQRRRARALSGRRLRRRPTLPSPLVAPRRSRCPESGGHEAQPRSPALARPAAAAMSRGPEEVNRLTESTYRVSPGPRAQGSQGFPPRGSEGDFTRDGTFPAPPSSPSPPRPRPSTSPRLSHSSPGPPQPLFFLLWSSPSSLSLPIPYPPLFPLLPSHPLPPSFPAPHFFPSFPPPPPCASSLFPSPVPLSLCPSAPHSLSLLPCPSSLSLPSSWFFLLPRVSPPPPLSLLSFLSPSSLSLPLLVVLSPPPCVSPFTPGPSPPPLSLLLPCPIPSSLTLRALETAPHPLTGSTFYNQCT